MMKDSLRKAGAAGKTLHGAPALRKSRGAARIRRTYNGRTPWPLAVSQKISQLWKRYLAERGYGGQRLEDLRSKIYRELDHGASSSSLSSSVKMADVVQLLKMSTFVKTNLSSSSREPAVAATDCSSVCGWLCSSEDRVDHAGLPVQRAGQQCAVHGWRCFSGFTLEDVKKSETRLCLHCMQCRFMTCSKCCL